MKAKAKPQRKVHWVFKYRVAPRHEPHRRPGARGRNERVAFVAGFRGALAFQGYWTPQVQRVVRKWQGQVPEAVLQDLFASVALAALWRSTEATVKVQTPNHWPLVWQLATALDKVRSNTEHPNYWLLQLPTTVAQNCRWQTWDEVSAAITKAGGPDFDARTLRQQAKRLRLVPSLSEVKDYLGTV